MADRTKRDARILEMHARGTRPADIAGSARILEMHARGTRPADIAGSARILEMHARGTRPADIAGSLSGASGRDRISVDFVNERLRAHGIEVDPAPTYSIHSMWKTDDMNERRKMIHANARQVAGQLLRGEV